jgi:BclB C-terminal domain-containing protein
VLTAVLGGLANLSALVGFGNSTSGVLGSDLLAGSLSVNNFAFSMPRAGQITSISAYFTNTLGISLIGTTVTIRARIYISSPPTNAFVQLSPGVALPALTGIIAVGTTVNASAALSLSVAAQARLLLVFTVDASPSIAAVLTGYASGGLTIV